MRTIRRAEGAAQRFNRPCPSLINLSQPFRDDSMHAALSRALVLRLQGFGEAHFAVELWPKRLGDLDHGIPATASLSLL